MTKINLSVSNRRATAEFLEFLQDTVERLEADNVSEDIIIPHMCGMLMTANHIGLLDDEKYNALLLSIMIDVCNE